jgi:hypothetical protein
MQTGLHKKKTEVVDILGPLDPENCEFVYWIVGGILVEAAWEGGGGFIKIHFFNGKVSDKWFTKISFWQRIYDWWNGIDRTPWGISKRCDPA